MSLMSGLYVGTSGLQTSQNALNTTAHNLANINTTGYTRQQVTQGDRMYDTVGRAYIQQNQVGLGVNYADVRIV
nr:flagellar basal body protein [Lachnospiraceae bacterium]